jgi:hypothetical protein
MIRHSLLVASLCLSTFKIHPELLIVQKINDQFAALSKQDALTYGPVISATLLKYQWPMCIASKLTKEEQDELLTAGRPNSEELFIQKKLNELLPDLNLDVIFIPTALYELFCIIEFFKNEKQIMPVMLTENLFSQCNSFEKAGMSVIESQYDSQNKFKIDLSNILNEQNLPKRIHQDIYSVYFKMNNLFFETKESGSFRMKNNKGKFGIFEMPIFAPEDESASMYINNTLITWLINNYPELSQEITALNASIFIEKKSSKICSNLLTDLVNIESIFIMKYANSLFLYRNESIQNMIMHLKQESQNHIVQKVIALEYKAHANNKALLLRGSTFIKFQTGPDLGQTKNIQKSTLVGTTLVQPKENDKATYLSLEQTEKNQSYTPYSISFGNSLFAGFILDAQACAYNFLMGARLTDDALNFPFKTAGYGLMINKLDYVQHRNNRLFFIPPLASIAALFASGEYFHARTTAAIHSKTQDYVEIKGVAGDFSDASGILLIRRDPLKHAELFSNFLAKNGQIIQTGDGSSFTQEERTFVDQVIQNQIEAAKFYKAIHTIKPKIDRAAKQHRNKKSLSLNNA